MSFSTAHSPRRGVLANALWPAADYSGSSRMARFALLAIGGSIAMWISAKVQVPFWPVPLTFQTLVTLVIGFAFGPRLAFTTLALYLAEGAVGLPVFANTPERGIGIAYMVGPTGGYLFGFLVAGTLTGWLAQRGWDRRPVTTVAGMIIGNAIIYALGIAWLGSVIGWDKPVLQFGMIPFLWGDLLKVLLAAAVMPMAWKLVGRR